MNRSRALDRLAAGMLTAFLLAAPGSSAFGSEQGLFYHLHQATSLLEQVLRGDCGAESGLVRMHLIEADAELGQVLMRSSGTAASPLEPAAQELWELFNRRRELKVVEVEAYRLRLREQAVKMRLRHEKAWHEETAFCGAGDPLKAAGPGPAVEIDAGKLVPAEPWTFGLRRDKVTE